MLELAGMWPTLLESSMSPRGVLMLWLTPTTMVATAMAWAMAMAMVSMVATTGASMARGVLMLGRPLLLWWLWLWWLWLWPWSLWWLLQGLHGKRSADAEADPYYGYGGYGGYRGYYGGYGGYHWG